MNMTMQNFLKVKALEHYFLKTDLLTPDIYDILVYQHAMHERMKKYINPLRPHDIYVSYDYTSLACLVRSTYKDLMEMMEEVEHAVEQGAKQLAEKDTYSADLGNFYMFSAFEVGYTDVELTVLWELLKQFPHTINGDFGSTLIDFNEGDTGILVQMNNQEYFTIKSYERNGDSMFTATCTDGEIVNIQFFKPAKIEEL